MLSKKFKTALDSVKELTLRGNFTNAHKALDKLLKKDPTSRSHSAARCGQSVPQV